MYITYSYIYYICYILYIYIYLSVVDRIKDAAAENIVDKVIDKAVETAKDLGAKAKEALGKMTKGRGRGKRGLATEDDENIRGENSFETGKVILCE